MKRLAIKKLPPILVIQLKRFDYDFERDAAVKFNDYFEFPRELDMEPYTVAGLARSRICFVSSFGFVLFSGFYLFCFLQAGERGGGLRPGGPGRLGGPAVQAARHGGAQRPGAPPPPPPSSSLLHPPPSPSTFLILLLLHPPQASGGHYYSYIKDGEKWFKFDDGDVTEVNMADDEEFKSQVPDLFVVWICFIFSNLFLPLCSAGAASTCRRCSTT